LKTLLLIAALGLGGLVLSWAIMAVLAKRMKSDRLRQLMALLPDCVTTMRRLRRDPRVPRSARLALVAAAVWVASPIDLVPEFIPVVGLLDDVLVVALALMFAARRVPRPALEEAWPGDPKTLEWLLGGRG
jgi:uncharacterized membrane protein YkvA (DUF1232 family)